MSGGHGGGKRKSVLIPAAIILMILFTGLLIKRPLLTLGLMFIIVWFTWQGHH